MSESSTGPSARSLFSRPFILVGLGFGLGYLARYLFGPPAEELQTLDRQFNRPLPVTMPDVDLPLDRPIGRVQTQPNPSSEGASEESPEDLPNEPGGVRGDLLEKP